MLPNNLLQIVFLDIFCNFFLDFCFRQIVWKLLFGTIFLQIVSMDHFLQTVLLYNCIANCGFRQIFCKFAFAIQQTIFGILSLSTIFCKLAEQCSAVDIKTSLRISSCNIHFDAMLSARQLV